MQDFYHLTPDAQSERLAHLARQVLTAWDIRPESLSLIKMRENAVFDVRSEDGRRFALRVHRAGYHSDAALESELEWMCALGASGIEVPRVIPLPDGSLFTVAGGAETGGPRQVDLFAWIEGTPMGSTEAGVGGDEETLRSAFAQLGRLAARLHNQACAWPLPAGFERHAWDLEGLVGEGPLWGRFWDLAALSAAQRDLMLRVRTRLRDELSAFPQTPDCYGLIHADFAPENVFIVDGSVQLIDFDDSGFGWHLFELAAAVVFLTGEPTFEPAREALFAGYLEQRPLSEATLAQWPALLMARATTYLGWVHTRSETETARELTAPLIALNCALGEDYLAP